MSTHRTLEVSSSVQVLINTGIWGFFLIEIVNVSLAIISWVMAYKYYKGVE